MGVAGICGQPMLLPDVFSVMAKRLVEADEQTGHPAEIGGDADGFERVRILMQPVIWQETAVMQVAMIESSQTILRCCRTVVLSGKVKGSPRIGSIGTRGITHRMLNSTRGDTASETTNTQKSGSCK